MVPTNTFIQFSFLPYIEDSRPAVQLPRARIPFFAFSPSVFIHLFFQPDEAEVYLFITISIFTMQYLVYVIRTGTPSRL